MLPAEGGIASTDAPQCNASDLRAVFHPREAGLASPDAFPGIATWRGLGQPCVPARSSPALRLISPVTGSLSSLVSEANLSTTLFLVD